MRLKLSGNMNTKVDRKNPVARQRDSGEADSQEGYPLYPPVEDIYSQYYEEKDLDPDMISRGENSTDPDEFIISDESDFLNENSDITLGISELEEDEYRENIGLEDEENNYYSLGGDDHHDLEEEPQNE